MSRFLLCALLLSLCSVFVATVPVDEIALDVSSTTVTTTAGEKKQSKYLTAIDVPTCEKNSPDLNACLKNLFETMFFRLKDGDAELNIPAIDPFVLNKTTFLYESGPVKGRILMKEATISGFVNMKHDTVNLELKGDHTKLHVLSRIPMLNILGRYKGEFAYNNVRLKPKGNFNVTLLNVSLDQVSEGTLYDKDGHRIVRLTKIDIKPKVGDMKLMFDGVFPDPTLNEIVLSLANQYWREIFAVMLPETRKYWAPMVLKVINEALTIVPFEEFIKNI